MVWKEYPLEIKKYFDICDLYIDDMLKHKPVPDYVLEAFNKINIKEWAWKQGQ